MATSTEYTVCQAFCPVVQIGSPHPLTFKRVLLPPLGPNRETHSLAGEGVGEPNSYKGKDTLVLYVYYNPSPSLPLIPPSPADLIWPDGPFKLES
jgi:hypothetical protein